jgi:CHAT domain-containing protein
VRAWPVADGRLVLDDLRPPGAVGAYLSADQLARRLGQALLEPLAAAAGPARHLVFVGDDELVGVPLQALPLGGGLAIDRYDISYAPSLTTYARWQEHRADRHPRDLLAIGGIGYPRHAGAGADDPVALELDYAADHPLPRTRDEVTAIGALFPAARTRLMLGAAAGKTALRSASRSGELAGYRYVHLATHAWADPDRPEGSAVVLAGEGSEPPLQVVLTAAELAGLRMRADLIVLSACDTGAGHFEHGRGLLGLAYAALAAGNRAAVLSLWPIADDSTALFMAHFYARLAHGSGPVAALGATQREFRESADPRLSDPVAWAPFVLYGAY